MKILPCSKTYGASKALELPALTLEEGRICAVIGSNGSGKSTFAKILAGVLAADGNVRPLDGVRVGYLPQKPYGFQLSVEQNIRLGGRDSARAKALMEALQLTRLARKRADRLSGGESARMALARLLMGEYDLVILDEPTAAMDMASNRLAEGLIGDYAARTGCAVLLVTHSLRQARRMADQVLFFQGGTLAEQGPAAILDQPQTEQLRMFLEFYGL